MARKRKPYRNVQNKNFLRISEMPLMENRKSALGWIESSDVMEYVYSLAREWKFIIATMKDDGSHIWQGINYETELRDINREIKTSYGEKVIKALIEDEIDLMPPLRHKYPGEVYSMENSEVIQYLGTKINIMNLIFVTAAYNGLVVINEDGSYIGINNKESRSNG